MTTKPSYFRLFRHDLCNFLQLFDSNEIVLYLLLISKAGWDHRHKEKYSMVDATMRELTQDTGWSVGTVHKTLTGLERKGFIKKGRGRIEVYYLWAFTTLQKVVYGPEQYVQLGKHIVPSDEQNLRRAEQRDLQRGKYALMKKFTIPHSK